MAVLYVEYRWILIHGCQCGANYGSVIKTPAKFFIKKPEGSGVFCERHTFAILL